MHNTTTALIEMIDDWAEAFENEKITGVVMYDQSAAFDVCDHVILLNKLKIYGLQEGALAWFSSYLEDRKQSVYIDGTLSEIKKLERAGVPQGGNLSPLLYNIFCSDLPEAIHDSHNDNNINENKDNENEQNDDEYQTNLKCKTCGKIVCYADDCTYSTSEKDPEVLKTKIETSFHKISDYMTDNKLFLNSDKTHLLIMSSARSHTLHDNFDITLNTGSEIIKPTGEERLLGANVTNDFLWKNHLRDGKKSLISTLKSKNNALSVICHYSSFYVRKMFANGLIMSHIIYHIQVYGGCSDELLTAIQVQQNRSARMVCRMPWGTSTASLLKQMGWMSVRQMVAFYSIKNIFKTRQTQLPKYVYNIISEPFVKRTRLADTRGIRDIRKFTKGISTSTYIPRAIALWNSLPPSIRMEESAYDFNGKLLNWVKSKF